MLLVIVPAVIFISAFLSVLAGRTLTDVSILRESGLIRYIGPDSAVFRIMETLETVGNLILHNAIVFIVIGAVTGILLSLWDKESVTMPSLNNEGGTVAAPVSGRVIPLEEVNDGVFSEKMIGEGFAVEPSEGKLFAPSDCRVLTIFETKHAVSLILKNGIELMIHIGIDTVKLKGAPFNIKVKEGDELKKGELICTFDINRIIKKGYRTDVLVILTDNISYSSFELVKTGYVKAGDDVFNVK